MVQSLFFSPSEPRGPARSKTCYLVTPNIILVLSGDEEKDKTLGWPLRLYYKTQETGFGLWIGDGMRKEIEEIARNNDSSAELAAYLKNRGTTGEQIAKLIRKDLQELPAQSLAP
ncbi:hypothetical protein BN59_00728 [Legionella massiliensis]|uniref:Uncharacterized protein n=1 Tax=Legionella massiliensis TaxID=1034943 RepID=A0A078KXH8_9GAMM|nr:hypothetical protein [Legionella massiliensis]CDZ76459.1 hypothetical protein BN59_00728 [Legionella massiliensis]CEE12197.1 hypothetical protein BN1094_00728 [Legionella massiliensis]